MKFVFWNICNSSVSNSIASIANCYGVDVFVLAEARSRLSSIVDALNASSPDFYVADSLRCDRISTITKFDSSFVRLCSDEPRLLVHNYELPGRDPLLVAAVHLHSRLYFEESDIAAECEEIALVIDRLERDLGHERTVVVGDFNQNPFERGITSARGMNAVISRKVAAKKLRSWQGLKYKYLYNPTWNLYGDMAPGPPGTYYYHRTRNVELYWHMIDQVMIRPSLTNRFYYDSFKILEDDGVQPLLTSSGRPNKSRYSDHLPIMFEIM